MRLPLPSVTTKFRIARRRAAVWGWPARVVVVQCLTRDGLLWGCGGVEDAVNLDGTLSSPMVIGFILNKII